MSHADEPPSCGRGDTRGKLETMSELARVFHEDVRGRGDVPEDGGELERLLQHTLETAGRPWPDLSVPADVFVRYLAQRLPPVRAGVPLAQVLERMHVADLYVACACMHKVPEAIPTLERHYLAELPAHLKQPASVADEVCQSVRIQLLVGTPQAGPRLATYMGHGSLRNWLRVMAVHLIPHKPAPIQGSPEENILQVLEALPAPGPDAELDLARSRFQRDFRKALRDAFATLAPEQRRLLRFYYVDRVTTTELGRLFGMNQSTASRRLALARETVYEETRHLLQERLQLSSQEFDSLLIAVRSRLDVSISQLLGEPDEVKA
jgi:RNA polymerase sigma-70 factor (ECF subfamily)